MQSWDELAVPGQVIRKERFFGEEVEVVYRPARRPHGSADGAKVHRR